MDKVVAWLLSITLIGLLNVAGWLMWRRRKRDKRDELQTIAYYRKLYEDEDV